MKRPRRVLISLGIFAFALTACGGGGGSTLPSGGGTPVPTPTPTATPTITPVFTPKTYASSLNCTTQGASQSVARQSFSTKAPAREITGRMAARAGSDYVPGLVAVTYDETTFASQRATVSKAALDAGAQERTTLHFSAIGRVVETLEVGAGREAQAMAQLRTNSAVKSVSRIARRYKLSTTASSAFPNDPYFNGFTGGNTPPLYQAQTSYNSYTLGQWDMHAICAANAWAYGKTNSTGQTYPGALGGTAKIAIIDTGADLNHPELSGRVTYAESDLNGTTTVGLTSMTDTDGHGTDVAGIAAASANNGVGFAGVAYNAPLMVFKVFPDCGTSNCTADTRDVALAINHAVTQNAKVISMSLGGPMDPTEETAVANAIAANVVVVAASGNEYKSSLDYPAADPGVIAVGASALDDSSSVVNETVASYSNYDASNPTSWGLVAPGGDPAGNTDNDNLHWIENIYTSQASDSNSRCTPDFGNASGPTDCRILIAGTSQATPHVAGAASLLLSVGASPNNIKSILCSTATPLVGAKAGCGRLNVYKAMAQVVGDPSP